MQSFRTPDAQGVFSERNIHRVFDISLWIKGVFAFGEILSGIATFFVTKELIVHAVELITQAEFAEDLHDRIATILLQVAENYSVGARNFAAIYLLAHGVIKLWLIIGLLRRKLWFYPAAIIVFTLFIVYQLYRFTYTHSALLLLITVLDVIVIVLTWHEWKYLRRHPSMTN